MRPEIALVRRGADMDLAAAAMTFLQRNSEPRCRRVKPLLQLSKHILIVIRHRLLILFLWFRNTELGPV